MAPRAGGPHAGSMGRPNIVMRFLVSLTPRLDYKSWCRIDEIPRGIIITGGSPMRVQFFALSFIAAAAAAGAFAQQAAAQQTAPPPLQTFLNNKDIMALVDRAKA